MSVFERCLAADPAAHGAILDAECGADAELRAQVEGMLAADAAGGSAVDHPLMDRLLESIDAPSPLPDRIGPYRVIREIGSGGMGVVFEAEQSDPRRTVAVKVLSAFASPMLARRLRREAQVLAQLDHPYITRVLDTGVAEYRGRVTPYLAMELVDGVRIDEFVRTRRPGLHQRLELLARVADAVHAAHQRGVIHRDLKPANILVTIGPEGLPQPRLLDFGVARLLEPQPEMTTLHTATGQLVGTLNYMSPEQLDGSPATDPRIDVYAIGVIAHELLSGEHPLELDGLSVVQAVKKLQTGRDPTLSIDGVPAPRQLEAIVRCALAREPNRRYPTAAELASDLRAFAAGTDVRARPPSAAYQLREFARRNRLIVSVTLATVVTLAIGLVGTTWFGVSASRKESRARWMSHRAFIAAASGAIEAADFVTARRVLDDCPAEHRGWEWGHLDERLSVGSVAFGGRPVRGLCADALHGAVLGISSGEVIRWDPDSGNVSVLPLPGDVAELSPSASAGRAVAVLETGEAVVFDTVSGVVISRIAPRGGQPWQDPTLDSAGSRVWMRTGDRGVVLDTERGEEVVEYSARYARFRAAIHPSGASRVHTAPSTFTMLRDIATGSLTRARHRHPGSVVAFSPDGERFAVGTTLREIHVFNTDSLTLEHTLIGHSGEAQCLAFADADTLVSAFSDQTWRVWDLRTGREQRAGPLAGATESLAVVGDTIVTCSFASEHAVSRHLRDERVFVHPQYVYALGWSPDGRMLASTAYEQGGTIVWDVPARAPIARLDTGGRTLPSIQFSPDGTHLVHSHLRSGEQQINVWDTA
ncbi:MAG: WD40 repeat domain-containing serine/threonine protein kinase, partial [Phycisphaerales bacterium JB041]